MVRVPALILIFFTVMSAFASDLTEKQIERLAKVVRESTDLELVHVALNELYLLAMSPVADTELRRGAGGTLIVLANESAARILAPKGSERSAEDLLTLHMANLGQNEQLKVLDIEKMIAIGTDRDKVAAMIFLRDHFLAKDPRDGFFPFRPESSETNLNIMNWQTDRMYSVIEKMPSVLATISHNSSLKRGTKLGEVAMTTYTRIAKILEDAAHDVKADPSATKEAMAIRMFRQRLATHWLDELSKTLLAWRENRRSSYSMDPWDDPDSILSCEKAVVTPLVDSAEKLH